MYSSEGPFSVWKRRAQKHPEYPEFRDFRTIPSFFLRIWLKGFDPRCGSKLSNYYLMTNARVTSGVLRSRLLSTSIYLKVYLFCLTPMGSYPVKICSLTLVIDTKCLSNI